MCLNSFIVIPTVQLTWITYFYSVKVPKSYIIAEFLCCTYIQRANRDRERERKRKRERESERKKVREREDSFREGLIKTIKCILYT